MPRRRAVLEFLPTSTWRADAYSRRGGRVLLTATLDPAPDLADVALIRRMTDGDETALAALYDRYAGLVFSVAKRIVGDPSTAEEILQDIFYQAWRSASSFDPSRGSFAGWLLVSARNRSIDRLRRRHGEAADPLPEDAVTLSVNIESDAAQRILLSKVTQVIGELPETQRAALEMAYFEGMTHSEIAERTGEPLGTIKTRLRAALGSLKKALKS